MRRQHVGIVAKAVLGLGGFVAEPGEFDEGQLALGLPGEHSVGLDEERRQSLLRFYALAGYPDVSLNFLPAAT